MGRQDNDCTFEGAELTPEGWEAGRQGQSSVQKRVTAGQALGGEAPARSTLFAWFLLTQKGEDQIGATPT